MRSNRAVFLDRDGTLNEDRGFEHNREQLVLVPNAVAGLKRLVATGFRLFIVTNQSGIARGRFTEDDMHAFNAELCRRLLNEGVEIEGVYFCPFMADATVDAYRVDSPNRKPRPGMLLQAAAEHGLDLAGSVMIGDKQSDVLAGQAAGCRTILVRTGYAGSDPSDVPTTPDFVADDLLAAAEWIERQA